MNFKSVVREPTARVKRFFWMNRSGIIPVQWSRFPTEIILKREIPKKNGCLLLGFEPKNIFIAPNYEKIPARFFLFIYEVFISSI